MANDSEINSKKVIEEFDRRAVMHKNENAVLDAGKNHSIERKNIYRDYISKHQVKAYLQPNKNEVLLDFGCGVGRLSKFLSPNVNKIVGVDKSHEMIEVAKSSTEASFKNIQYTFFENYPLPVADTSVDKAFTFWVLQHVGDEELKTTFSEFYRILKPSGKVFLFEQIRPIGKLLGEIHRQRSIEEYIHLAESAGLKIKLCRPVFRFPSYSMDIWFQQKWLPKYSLPFLAMIENMTVNRKPETIEYTTNVLVFQKDNK